MVPVKNNLNNISTVEFVEISVSLILLFVSFGFFIQATIF